MLAWRRFLILLLTLAVVLLPRLASASIRPEPENRVGVFELPMPALLGGIVARSPENHRTITPFACDLASGRSLRWKGRWFENVAGGIYDVRARWWSPQMGAFLSVDEFAFHDVNSTLWGWPGQNPIRSRDPSGHFDPTGIGAWLAAQGATGGAGAGAGAFGAGFAALALADVAILGTLAYEVNGLINDLNTPTVYGGGRQPQGGVCSASGGGGMGGGGVPPVITGGAGGTGGDAGSGGIRGLLSGLQPGKNANVYVVGSDAELQAIFDQLSAGGSPVQSTYPGDMVELADGTRIGMRPTSLTGGATIDINQPGSPIIKIHIGP